MIRALFLALLLLSACAPAPTLTQDGSVQLYLSLSGDVIVETPREIDYGTVRVAAERVSSPYLLSPKPSVYGYLALRYPDEEANYGTCIRIPAEGVTAAWVGLTMLGDDYSVQATLTPGSRKPPEGC